MQQCHDRMYFKNINFMTWHSDGSASAQHYVCHSYPKTKIRIKKCGTDQKTALTYNKIGTYKTKTSTKIKHFIIHTYTTLNQQG